LANGNPVSLIDPFGLGANEPEGPSWFNDIKRGLTDFGFDLSPQATIGTLNSLTFGLAESISRGVVGWNLSEQRGVRGNEGDLARIQLTINLALATAPFIRIQQTAAATAVGATGLSAETTGPGPAHMPVSGSQWYEYFSSKYGAENVSWSRLPQYTGGKTTGVLASSVGDIELLSGESGPAASFGRGQIPGRNGAIMWHVEAHAAATMRQLGLNEATLYINRVPCGPAQGWNGGCEFMLDRMLPPGARLRVVGPGGYDKIFGLPH
jgi:SCP1.201-like deaminase